MISNVEVFGVIKQSQNFLIVLRVDQSILGILLVFIVDEGKFSGHEVRLIFGDIGWHFEFATSDFTVLAEHFMNLFLVQGTLQVL